MNERHIRALQHPHAGLTPPHESLTCTEGPFISLLTVSIDAETLRLFNGPAWHLSIVYCGESGALTPEQCLYLWKNIRDPAFECGLSEVKTSVHGTVAHYGWALNDEEKDLLCASMRGNWEAANRQDQAAEQSTMDQVHFG